MVLAVPDGLAHVLCHLALLRGKLYLAERVGANGVEGIAQLCVFLHPFEKVHLLTSPVTKAVQLYVTESAFVHGLAQVLGKLGIPAFLVVAT